MENTILFPGREDYHPEQRREEPYDLSDHVIVDQQVRGGERKIDYSQDIVVRKLRRMLP